MPGQLYRGGTRGTIHLQLNNDSPRILSRGKFHRECLTSLFQRDDIKQVRLLIIYQEIAEFQIT